MTQEALTPDEQRYLVHNPLEIAQILNDLARNKVMLKVSFNHGADSYLTTVIEASVDKHAVYLDVSRDEGFNQRMAENHHVLFTRDEGVRIRWLSTHVSLVKLTDGPAVKVALPQNMLRMQRREFHRLATPRANSVPCRIPLVDADGHEHELHLALTDASLGGIGAISTELREDIWQQDAEFKNCKIEFPNVGTTNLTLRVANAVRVKHHDGSERMRIGFQFIEPSRGNQGLIQRYIFNLEKEEAALLAGAAKG